MSRSSPSVCSPLVACEHCKGTGTVPLTRDMLRTWQRLSDTKPLLVTALLEDGVTPNAINNRLVALERLGLAVRTGKVGKWVLWLRANVKDEGRRTLDLANTNSNL